MTTFEIRLTIMTGDYTSHDEMEEMLANVLAGMKRQYELKAWGFTIDSPKKEVKG